MKEVLQPLIEPLGNLLASWLPYTAIVLIALTLSAFCYTRLHTKLAQMRQRRRDWKLNGGKIQLFKPSSWFALEFREYSSVKSVLLRNDAVRELYAPTANYTRELREKEKPWKLAWLSPYPEAVKASIKASNTPKSKKLDARKQIAAVAKEVKIRSLPESMTIVEVAETLVKNEESESSERKQRRINKQWAKQLRSNHFRIDLPYLGKDPGAVERVEGALVKQLALTDYKRLDSGDPTLLSYIAHRKPITDPLVKQAKGVDWLDAHPAKSPKSLPIAVKEDGSTWTLGTHHTLILGETGSGKGSPLQAAIRQLAPFVRQGIVKLHGIDPKATELKVFKEIPGLFEEVVYDPEPAVELITSLKEQMDHRSRSLGIDEESMDAMRSIDPSREMPWHILIIDELWDLLDDIGAKGPGYVNLNSIGRKGRAPGFFLLCATQSVEDKVMGNLRKHFINKLPLRQESPTFNTFMLGEGAAERGFDTTLIGASTPENGYAYAGIGYSKKGSADPERIRYAYSSDKDIIKLAQSFRDRAKDQEEEEQRFTNDFDDDGGFSISSENDSEQMPSLELFSFEEELPRAD